MKEKMKVRYIGPSFGIDSLTNGKVYEVIEVDEDGALRVIDDSDEDYLYSPTRPGPIAGKYLGGKWEIISDPNGQLAKVIT